MFLQYEHRLFGYERGFFNVTSRQRESGGRLQLQRKVQPLPYSSGCCYKQVALQAV